MIVLDIETLDFFDDPHIKRLPRPIQLLAMQFGCAYTYDTTADMWVSYWPVDHNTPLPPDESVLCDRHALMALWRRLINQTILGWNLFEFDMPYIMLHINKLGYEGDAWLDPMSIIDLMAIIKRATRPFGKDRWYKLGDIAQVNLGRGKLGDGRQAAEWLRSGDPALVARAAAYCREDVQLCLDLFRLSQTTGLLLPARPERDEESDLRLWLDEDGKVLECRRARRRI
jgi:hypothetical protein